MESGVRVGRGGRGEGWVDVQHEAFKLDLEQVPSVLAGLKWDKMGAIREIIHKI